MLKSVFGSISGAATGLVATVYGDGEIARSGRVESLENGWVFPDAETAEFTPAELEAAALQISGMMIDGRWVMAETPEEYLRRNL